jgi:mRNA interferase RelE/StbE
MASYKLSISKTAERQLRELPKQEKLRVARAITRLANEPRPQGCRKLSGHDDLFRIRVGTYRVIYSIDDHEVVVVILKLGHRKDVYR